MTRVEIEHLEAHPKKYDIHFIVGVDSNPEDARNAMFYIRMKSFRKEEERHDFAREIWLSCDDMEKLSELLIYASKYWDRHTLRKGTNRTKRDIDRFNRVWEKKKAKLGFL